MIFRRHSSHKNDPKSVIDYIAWCLFWGLIIGFLIRLLCLTAPACTVFNDNSNYCREGVTAWYIAPDTNDWPLFLNGVDQNSPDHGGPASIDWTYGEPKRQIKVGICDNSHGQSLDWIITNIAS